MPERLPPLERERPPLLPLLLLRLAPCEALPPLAAIARCFCSLMAANPRLLFPLLLRLPPLLLLLRAIVTLLWGKSARACRQTASH